MSTIYTFHEECAEIGAALAADDEILVYDTSAGRTKSAAASRLNTLATGAATPPRSSATPTCRPAWSRPAARSR